MFLFLECLLRKIRLLKIAFGNSIVRHLARRTIDANSLDDKLQFFKK